MHTNQLPVAALAALLMSAGLLPLAGLLPTATASHAAIPITSQEWYDVDHNGHLDAVVATVGTATGAPAFDLLQTYPSDFQIGGGPFATGISRGRFGDTTASMFTLYFPECYETPDLAARSHASGPLGASAFDCRGLDAGANTPTQTISVQAHSPHYRYSSCTGGGCRTDRAEPVLKAAYTIGGSLVTAVFNEPIAIVDGDDFCFEDWTGTYFRTLVMTTTFPSRTVQVRVMAPSWNGNPATPVFYNLDPNDYAVDRLANGGAPPARLYMHRSAAGCATQPLSAFADPQGNVGVDAYSGDGQAPNWGAWATDFPGAVPVGAPVPVRVHASVDDNHVVVEFTGPVGDNGGQTLTSGFAVAGNPQNWGIASGGIRQSASTFGSDRVAITSTVRLLDLTNFVVTAQNSIYGTGTSASTPGVSWPLSDASYLSSPRVTALEMLDGDANGCIDAIKVTFNEKVNDAVTTGGAATGWSVFWPNTGGTTGTTYTNVRPVTGGAASSGGSNVLYLPNGVDDRFVFLTFPTPLDLNRPGAANCHDTGAADAAVPPDQQLPRVSFCDSACPAPGNRPHDPPPSVPAYLHPASLELRVGVALIGDDGAAYPRMYREPALDAAPPVLREVHTLDCNPSTCLTAPPDGRLSYVRLAFSEPVADAFYGGPGAWQVSGAGAGACTTAGAAPSGSYSVNAILPDAFTPDSYFHFLQLTNPHTPSSPTAPRVWDTGCIPDIATPSAPGVRDLSGNCDVGTGSRSLCSLAAIQRGPRFHGTMTPAASLDSFTDAGFAKALEPFCTASTPAPQACSPAIEIQVTEGSGAGIYQVTRAASDGTITFTPAMPSGTPAAPYTYLAARAVNEWDRAGPALVDLVGSIASPFGQALFSERACGYRSVRANVDAGASARTSLTSTDTFLLSAVARGFLKPGIPIAVSGGGAGTYTITAIRAAGGAATIDFAPETPAGTAIDLGAPSTVLVGCQQPEPADFVYRNNNNADVSDIVMMVGTHYDAPAEANKLDLTLTPNSGLTNDDISGPDKDCIQVKPPFLLNQYAPENSPLAHAVTDMSANLPWPDLPSDGADTPCVYWRAAGAAPEISAVVTRDSNRDGYLDALEVTLSQPIRDGIRLLRIDSNGNALLDVGDTVYFDSEAMAPYQDGSLHPDVGRASTDDVRYTAYPGCAACTPGSLVAAGQPDANLVGDATYNLLWADLGAPGPDLADGVWGDIDASNTVSHGDIRYTDLAEAAGAVTCSSAARDSDCFRPIGAGYADNDGSRLVSHGDTRPAIAGHAPGSVDCNATPADRDCGTPLTPMSYNLVASDFYLQMSGQLINLFAQCIVTGKGPGVLLGGTYSTCPGGVSGLADPGGAVKPDVGSSCAGALPNTFNDATIFVCFPVWYGVDLVSPIPDTGYWPLLNYVPNSQRPGGTVRSAPPADLPLGGYQGIYDEVCGPHCAPRAQDGANPVLVEVVGGAGQDSVSLVFSEPVSSSANNAQWAAGIGTGHVAYINGNAGSAYCRSGAAGLSGVGTQPQQPFQNGTWGATKMTLADVRLDAALSHDDVVGCVQNPLPAPQTVARDGLRALPSIFEWRSSRPLVDPGAVSFTDSLAPSIDRADFIDASGDGVIDAVRITFTEPVNDCFGPVGAGTNLRPPATFPQGPVNCDYDLSSATPDNVPDPAHAYNWVRAAGGVDHRDDFEVKVGATALQVKYIVTGQAGAAGELCKGHYNAVGKPSGVTDADWMAPLVLNPGPTGEVAPPYGAPDGFNDNTVFLCLDPDSTLTSPAHGTKDLAEGTATLGTLAYTPSSPVACLNPEPDRRPVCDISNLGPAGAFTSPAKPMLSASKAVKDAARPVMVSAKTDDRDHNGKVDSVRVGMSEAVDPRTLSAADWNVAGRAIAGFDVAGSAGTNCPATSTSTVALRSFWICFAEAAGASTFDTDLGHAAGTGPRVSYAAGGALKDVSPDKNAARARDAVTTDGAQPVVVRIQSSIGSTTSTVTFSEPVDARRDPNSPTLSITYNDTYYVNPPNQQGGSSSGFGTTNQVVHSPGDRAAVFTLNAPASQKDIDEDKICFVAGHVVEHGGGLDLYDPTCTRLNGIAGDRQPPGTVGDLGRKLAASSASLNVLEWTAPPDNDLGAYHLYVCVCDLRRNVTATSIGNSGAIEVPGTMPTPVKGTQQTASHAPLGNWDAGLYYALVVTDTAGNPSLSNVLFLQPPNAVPGAVTSFKNVVESSANGDQVSLTWAAPAAGGTTTASGKVDHYEIYVIPGAGPVAAGNLTPARQVAASNLSPDLRTGGAAVIAAPGADQTVTIRGLTPNAQYQVVVVPVDAAGLKPAFTTAQVKSVTPVRTGTGVGPETIPTLTASPGTPPSSAALLTWTAPRAPGDPGNVPTGYKVWTSTLDLNAAANQATRTEVAAADLVLTPTPPAAPGLQQQATVRGLDENTTYWFLVAAVDSAGRAGAPGAAASLRTAADANPLTAADIRERNLGIDVSVSFANGTGNTITWALPDEDPLHPTRGVQVWRCASSNATACQLIATLDAASAGFRNHTYTDAQGTEDDRYLVTAYYGTSPAKGYARSSADAGVIPGFADLEPTGAGAALPDWLWWAVGGALLLLVIVLAVWLATRRRRPAAAPGEEGEGEAPAEEAGMAAAPAEEGGAPAEAAAEMPPPEAPAAAAAPPPPLPPPRKSAAHHITCPKCSTEFTATGVKPLVIQCPNCGVRGTLR